MSRGATAGARDVTNRCPLPRDASGGRTGDSFEGPGVAIRRRRRAGTNLNSRSLAGFATVRQYWFYQTPFPPTAHHSPTPPTKPGPPPVVTFRSIVVGLIHAA